MRSGTIRIWATVHKWSSLVSTAFLLMLCVTGLPLIFYEEIDALSTRHAPLATLPPGTPSLSLDRILARALANRPGEVPLYISFDTHRPVVNVTTGPTPNAAASKMHFLSLDQRTATILPAEPPGGLMALILRIHTDMTVGLWGELLLGAMGVLFFAAILSGIVLYAPFMARLRFGTIRHGSRVRLRWTDLHNLLGVTTAMWAAIVGLSGTINTLSTPLTDYWKADQLAGMTQPFIGQPVPRQIGSVEQAMAKAIAAAPGMRPQFIAFPGVAFSSSHHLAIFMQGRTPATRKLLTPVLIDARTGRLEAVQPMPWYMQALLLSQPLHFGDYAGLPMKLMWALLDLVTIVVLGSGLFLWFARRRRPAGS
jgi:uncharacterized iron-regulated membrane protein